MAKIIVIPAAEVAAEHRRRAAEAAAHLTVDDYNKALEARLLEVRRARGYTERDPSDYATSSVPRWAQDAKDWVKFRDSVMLWGLDILNQYQETGNPPMTLEAFRDGLAEMDCEWTYED